MRTERSEVHEEKRDTGRLEAFSDGVFAIAVTLLILEVRAPLPGTLQEGETLAGALLRAWPAYLAFATSFATLLIVWVNHHNLFRLIVRTDHALLLLNGFLLLIVTFIPFPTNVIAEYMQERDARAASVLYSGAFFVLALAFNALWRYAARGGRLLSRTASRTLIATINRQFAIGPFTYLACVIVALVNGIAGFVGIVLVALYWALPEHLRPGPKGAEQPA